MTVVWILSILPDSAAGTAFLFGKPSFHLFSQSRLDSYRLLIKFATSIFELLSLVTVYIKKLSVSNLKLIFFKDNCKGAIAIRRSDWGKYRKIQDKINEKNIFKE